MATRSFVARRSSVVGDCSRSDAREHARHTEEDEEEHGGGGSNELHDVNDVELRED